jgi:two-component system response regulator PilR (NtrC family)
MKAQPLTLVVDDNEGPRRAIRLMLEQLVAARVIEAATSQKALELAVQHNFDLVTSDLTRAPIDGLKFLQILKWLRPTVPVIIISAVLNPANKESATSMGAFACLDKPFTLKQLRQIVESALGL